MRTVRWVWFLAVTLLGTASVVAAVRESGLAPLLAGVGVITAMGITLAFVWIEPAPDRVHLILQSAGWSALGGVLLVSTPELLDAWSLLAFVVIGATCPPALDLLAQWARAHLAEPADAEPSDLSFPELARRWRVTSDELGHRITPARRLELVEERSRLLDEFERRDPDGYESWLAVGAWRELQGR